MTDRENRIEAITFDLKESINDLTHEFKELAKDVDKLKEKIEESK